MFEFRLFAPSPEYCPRHRFTHMCSETSFHFNVSFIIRYLMAKVELTMSIIPTEHGLMYFKRPSSPPKRLDIAGERLPL